ncbi:MULTISPECIES: NADH-quinone oxidoreductase subunit J [unclassified Spirosoma]|uniref:NADH-quinone oxidoreductase subunit J family protein n=1 Tax=unclassified Spirosoma TaxID=2621999 RepID=UPI000962E1D2|nr:MULTISPECIES: NADH-quinone oxidoreductase subunit J [unclassified Spirosoma]MBN8824614.1 NADH-quinone oxidoreductase subunit J [Spirosoma sp.]OJW78831.1 MAG: NADH-quinone oxidoreductase subunit J [Spirosoma sp. 48-14]
MIQVAFYMFAALSLSGGLAVLFTRNVIYAAFFLLLTLLGVAGLFVLASADFLAIAQLMIYVGGVLVLVIFGVMLTNKTDPAADASNQQPNRIASQNRSTGWVISALVAGSLFVALFTLLARANFALLNQPVGWQSTVNTIGRQLMTEYVLPFEIVGILLLAALVGATYLASPLAKSFRNAAR